MFVSGSCGWRFGRFEGGSVVVGELLDSHGHKRKSLLLRERSKSRKAPAGVWLGGGGNIVRKTVTTTMH